MMPSNMNLRISDSVKGYNNKILISKKGFTIGKNKRVNNKNNLIVMSPPVVVNKPVVAPVVTPVASKPAPVVNRPAAEPITTEEEIVLAVTLAIIAGAIMIYKR